MKIATPEEIAQEEARKKEQVVEFTYLPLNQIVTAEQIRQDINTTGESFTGLMESIRARGVLEPVLVVRQEDGMYRLVVGERRFKACQMMGMETIPVRIVNQAGTKADVITMQLIENLERENLDPIDEAKAYVEFFRTKIGATDAAELISLIITFERDPGRVDKTFAENVSAIARITGKTTRSLQNLLSLLTLPRPFQQAVKEGKIGMSQGYIFAAHLDNPQLYQIFEAILKKPVTYEELKNLLEKAVAGNETTAASGGPFSGFYSHIAKVRTAFEKGKAAYTRQDMETLITELDAFSALLKEQVRMQATEAAPGT